MGNETYIEGYKGFEKKSDGTLRCLEMIYEVGKTYVHSGKIKLCQSGFHFCKELKKVNSYYSFSMPSTVVYKIKASGEIIHGDDKSVCSQIELLEEVNVGDINDEELLKIFLKYQESHNAVLGGSLALKLLKLLPNKVCGDLDIIIPTFNPFNKAECTHKSSTDTIVSFQENLDVKVDVFLNPYVKYKIINYKGIDYNVQLPEDIILAKTKYFFTNDKHREDLTEIIKNYGKV